MDDEVHFNSSGYRSRAIIQFLKEDVPSRKARSYQDPETGNLIDAPNRYNLKKILKEDSCFPLEKDPVTILKACADSQRQFTHFNFAANTKKNLNIGFHQKTRPDLIHNSPPVVILISKKFDTEIASLYWNLRADYATVAWLSFDMIEKDPKGISEWLNSDYGGKYFSFVGNEGMRKGNLTFSTSEKRIDDLKEIVNSLDHPTDSYTEWDIASFNNLKDYISGRPIIDRETISISASNSSCHFISPTPESDHGVASATLKMDKLLLPNKSYIRDLISESVLRSFSPGLDISAMPKFRINDERSITYQVQSSEHIEFKVPSASGIANAIVKNAGYNKIKQSATSQYQLEFLSKIGGLKNLPDYFGDKHLRKLFEILGDNENKHYPGWILNSIDRRGIHHLHLNQIFENKFDNSIKRYVDYEFEKLPERFGSLLQNGILERGFLLQCNNCSLKDWYRSDEITQSFKCNRCYTKQNIINNPIWVYKFTEVIYQGFSENMEVPLMSLYYLKRKSEKNFLWAPDLDLYWSENGEVKKRNVDFFVIRDGKSYIGEAKSSNDINKDQFRFYENLLNDLEIDGLIFSTSQNEWNDSTKTLIQGLKGSTNKEVISLTNNELEI